MYPGIDLFINLLISHTQNKIGILFGPQQFLSMMSTTIFLNGTIIVILFVLNDFQTVIKSFYTILY